MIRFTIDMGDELFQRLQAALSAFGEGRFPATSAAISGGAQAIAAQWRSFANGGPLEGVEPLKQPNRAYLFGIKTRKLGPFSHEIYNESEAADRVARGRPSSVDMKRTHTHGPRSRVSGEGIPYLIVPIRWGTPRAVGFKNVMPDAVWNLMKSRARFTPTVTAVSADSPRARRSRNARGALTGRASYRRAGEGAGWGSRLTADMAAGIPGDTSNMVGMTRMLGADGKAAGYFTFRVISATKPRGWDRRPHKKAFEDMWVLPAEPARDVIPALMQVSRRPLSELVPTALRSDLHGLLPQ